MRDFTIEQLTDIRTAILTVVDNGNPRDTRNGHWHFDTADQPTVATGSELPLSESQRESLADVARLDFCDSVQELLVKGIKEAT